MSGQEDASAVNGGLSNQNEVILEPGQILFREGEVGDRAYVVRSGRLEVSRRVGSAEVVIAVEGPGTILGEMALIDDQPRSATVRALEAASLTAVPKEGLRNLMSGLSAWGGRFRFSHDVAL